MIRNFKNFVVKEGSGIQKIINEIDERIFYELISDSETISNNFEHLKNTLKKTDFTEPMEIKDLLKEFEFIKKVYNDRIKYISKNIGELDKFMQIVKSGKLSSY